jgi:sugar O-acyltransferase (sialic acid O-acetyltransferase NeuD family)
MRAGLSTATLVRMPELEPRELLLVGAGGLAREAAEAVRAVNAITRTWDLAGFIDDDPAKRGARLVGIPVLGGLEVVADHPEAQLLLCPGRPDNYGVRRRLVERLGLDDERYATVVHPSASIGSTCRVGPGSVLLAHVTLTADVAIGRHVAVMPQTVLTHDVQVGDFATLASGVLVGGASRVAPGAYVGSGARLREGLTIGEGALVGMGSIVTRDVPAGRLWFGSPARDVSAAPGATLISPPLPSSTLVVW